MCELYPFLNLRPITDSDYDQWLDVFEVKQGDERLRSVLQRVERLICARRDHNKMARIIDDTLVRPALSPCLRPSQRPRLS